MVQPPFPDTEFGAYLGESLIMYQEAIKSFPAPEPPNEYIKFLFFFSLIFYKHSKN